jgi:hypothetical protein
MEKNFKSNKPVESRDLHKDVKKQAVKNDIRNVKEVKPSQNSKATSKIKKFFEQKSGKIQ